MLFKFSIINGHVEENPNGTLKGYLYVNPDESELNHLINDLKLDEHTVLSAQDPAETPRIEFEKEYTAVLVKYPRSHTAEDDYHFVIKTMAIFLLNTGDLVTIVDEKPLEGRLSGSREGRTAENLTSVQDGLLRVLSQIIRRFEMDLKRIAKCRDDMKERMIRSHNNTKLMEMVTLREGLVYYIEALRGNGHLLERLRVAGDRLGFTPHNLESLDDLAIENQQFLEQAEIYSQIMSDLMDAWSSIINNNLNIIMKNMNSLVIAISIPTFLTGLGGMSEFTSIVSPYMAWYVSYPLFFVIMMLMSVLVYRLAQHYYKV